MNDLEDKTKKVLSRERMLQRTKLLEDAAERPDITCVVVRLGLANLRTHVVRRSLHRESLVICMLQYLRDAEVAQLESVILG